MNRLFIPRDQEKAINAEESKHGYEMGWWGIPGSHRAGTQTHVRRDGKPLCGTHIHPKAEFQWCSRGIPAKVECPRCNSRLECIWAKIREAANV